MPDTIAAVATAPGHAALGIVRLSGPRALAAASSFCRPARGAGFEPRRATRARAERDGHAIDELIVVFMPGPRSATGEDLVELTAHGSTYILSELLGCALEAGARLAEPGEFTRRAYLNGRLDLAQAEAVGALIRARSQSAHRAALRQLDGGLSRALAQARAPLLDLLVRVEASLDHPEEDLPALGSAAVAAALERARGPVAELAASFSRGRLAAEGARVAIVGRPNAGKSSLLNALAGRERAIVSAEPGTTRDTIEEATTIEGVATVLVDTAGLRDRCDGDAERQGLERSRSALESCDLALLVVDAARPCGPEDERTHRRLLERAAAAGRPVVTVLNKADLGVREQGLPGIAASARTGAGLDALRRELGARLATEETTAALVTSARHHDALRRAAVALDKARGALGAWPAAWEDRAAAHLRGALSALDEITGAAAPDEVVREIFARFCIGK